MMKVRFKVYGATADELVDAASEQLVRFGDWDWYFDITVTPTVETMQGQVVSWTGEVVAETIDSKPHGRMRTGE